MTNNDRVRRRLIGAAVLLGATALTAFPAYAAYPDKPIRFICTSAAGSPLDAMMRQLGKQLSQELHQSVIVENMAGGSGAVGMSYALNQPADGYTVVAATGTTSFMMAQGNLPFKPDNFVIVRGLQAEPSAVAVRKDSPYTSLAQLVDALRERRTRSTSAAMPARASTSSFSTASSRWAASRPSGSRSKVATRPRKRCLAATSTWRS